MSNYKEILRYQIHDVGIFVDEDKDERWNRRVKELFCDQFDGFEKFINPSEVNRSIHVHNISRLSLEDDTIVVPEQSMYKSDGVIISKEWNVAYKLNNDSADFWVRDNTWFITYLLEELFIQTDSTYVHGAGISLENDDNKKGILLLAFGGIGKTCFISSAMKQKNVKLLGDDLIILNNDGTIMSYPRPFSVYPYHVTLFEDYFSHHPYKTYYVNNSQYFLRAARLIKRKLGLSLRTSREYMCVSPVRIYGEERVEQEAVVINDVYVMRRKTKNKEIQSELFNRVDETANFAESVLLHEFEVGRRVLYSKMANEFSSIKEYDLHLFDVIKNALEQSGATIHLVDIPLSMEAEEVAKKLTELIL